MYSLLQNKIKKLSLFYVNKTSPKVWEITIKLTIIQFIQYCRSSEELLKKHLNSGKINIKKKKYQLLYFSKLYNLHICVHWPSTKSQPFPKHEQSNLPIGLFAGTNAFRFFPGRFVVVPEDDAILELDVEGRKTFQRTCFVSCSFCILSCSIYLLLRLFGVLEKPATLSLVAI